MKRNATPPGLLARRIAAERLAVVLKGASFAPLGAAEIADGRDRALANRLITTALRYHGPIARLAGDLLARGLPKKAPGFEAPLHLSLGLLFLPDSERIRRCSSPARRCAPTRAPSTSSSS